MGATVPALFSGLIGIAGLNAVGRPTGAVCSLSEPGAIWHREMKTGQ